MEEHARPRMPELDGAPSYLPEDSTERDGEDSESEVAPYPEFDNFFASALLGLYAPESPRADGR